MTETSALEDVQARGYVEGGYIVVQGLLRDEEVEEIKREIVEVARRVQASPASEAEPDASDEEILRETLAVHHPHLVSPVLESYVKHPAVCEVLTRITAAHLPHWDGRVKAMQTMAFVKPPGFPGQAWHQDEVFIPTRDRSLLGAWIAIDDATVENGCLWVLPGSHRSGYLYPLRDHGQPEEFDAAQESYGFDDSEELAVELEAGSVLFFNGYLLHRSKKNRSEVYRRTLVTHYMNAWSLLPWKPRARPNDPNFAEIDRRNIVPVVGDDPYAWKGYERNPGDAFVRQRDRRRYDTAAR
ncbi:MAG: phytanoyl-CoA dioxygenase family protein [Actinobacteria bacterium]|nr:phytanoyl-CoA dioxygenase family protein [Actinomycetota bacterium]